MDEEFIGLGRVDEALFFRIEGDGGNNAVDVWMVLNLSPPAMENGGDAEF